MSPSTSTSPAGERRQGSAPPATRQKTGGRKNAEEATVAPVLEASPVAALEDKRPQEDLSSTQTVGQAAEAPSSQPPNTLDCMSGVETHGYLNANARVPVSDREVRSEPNPALIHGARSTNAHTAHHAHPVAVPSEQLAFEDGSADSSGARIPSQVAHFTHSHETTHARFTAHLTVLISGAQGGSRASSGLLNRGSGNHARNTASTPTRAPALRERPRYSENIRTPTPQARKREWRLTAPTTLVRTRSTFFACFAFLATVFLPNFSAHSPSALEERTREFTTRENMLCVFTHTLRNTRQGQATSHSRRRKDPG
jgi:hypothetical protein